VNDLVKENSVTEICTLVRCIQNRFHYWMRRHIKQTRRCQSVSVHHFLVSEFSKIGAKRVVP
jgi:hypothetical protein